MLTFSENGSEADKQMRAVIFYLTTFGYIDGDFDQSEKGFVKDYIAKHPPRPSSPLALN